MSLAHLVTTALEVRTKSQLLAHPDGKDSRPDKQLRKLLARAASMASHAQKEPPLLIHVAQEPTLQLVPENAQSAPKAGTAQEEKDPRGSAPPVTSLLPLESLTVTLAKLVSHALTTPTSHFSPWLSARKVNTKTRWDRQNASLAQMATSARLVPSPVPTAQLASTSMEKPTILATSHAQTAQVVTPAPLAKVSHPHARRVPTHHLLRSSASSVQLATSALRPLRTRSHALIHPSAQRPDRRRTRNCFEITEHHVI